MNILLIMFCFFLGVIFGFCGGLRFAHLFIGMVFDMSVQAFRIFFQKLIEGIQKR